jgi:uncharacterized membrane protein YhfC
MRTSLSLIPYIVYFFGPFLLAFFIGRRLLKAKYSVFAIGLLTFFAAWVCVMIAVGVSALKQETILYSIVVSASAGLFEESGRFFAFRIFKGLREKTNWNTGIMYAIGHSGMESIIVGANLLLTIVIVKYAPQVLSPELLNQSKAVLQIGFLQGLYYSFERLFVGLLIHSCLTSVVLLSLIKSQKRYLFLAMLWHCGHNMVGFNLGRLSEHWVAGKLWIVFVVVVYSWALFNLRKITAKGNT